VYPLSSREDGNESTVTDTPPHRKKIKQYLSRREFHSAKGWKEAMFHFERLLPVSPPVDFLIGAEIPSPPKRQLTDTIQMEWTRFCLAKEKE
jgi:hypothetical protein